MEGGPESQTLTDFTPTIILNVPLDCVTQVSATVRINNFASASTNRIDQVLTSAFAHDTPYLAELSYTRQLSDKRTMVGVTCVFPRNMTTYRATLLLSRLEHLRLAIGY
ncbi:hypothetical protein GCM10027346_40390 [Hymenobacter seoulensis]